MNVLFKLMQIQIIPSAVFKLRHYYFSTITSPELFLLVCFVFKIIVADFNFNFVFRFYKCQYKMIVFNKSHNFRIKCFMSKLNL